MMGPMTLKTTDDESRSGAPVIRAAIVHSGLDDGSLHRPDLLCRGHRILFSAGSLGEESPMVEAGQNEVQ